MREESSQLRLLARMFGGDMPEPCYPYFEQTATQSEEIYNAAISNDSELEPDGNGGYRWRQQ